jgi:hypothetical protein
MLNASAMSPVSRRSRSSTPVQPARDAKSARAALPPAGRRLARVCLTVAAAAASLVATTAPAQSPRTLGEMATEWARGNWASPVYCRIDGETVRGIRRVLIEPAKNPIPGRIELEVRFIDMQVENAERCFDLVGTEVPNLVGKMQLRFIGTSHPETVERDFERALRRDRGFEFDVVRGRLRVEIVGPGENRDRVQDVARSTAWIRRPAPASDADRALAEFRSPRKLELELIVEDGPTYRLPLFLTERR